MSKRKKTLVNYLIQYLDIQEVIFLVSHPTPNHSWGDRCIYGTSKYDPHKHYNHRAMLETEIVFEYDTDDPKKNKELTDKIEKRLIDEGFSYSYWKSGNKSSHLHTHIVIPEGVDVRTWKKTFMLRISEGLPRPDLLLCGDNHLIRAEYGVHEKTQKHKRLIRESFNYPFVKDAEELIRSGYDKYQEYLKTLPEPSNDLTGTKELDLLLDTKKFRSYRDGVERGLFILSHVLKEHKTKGEAKGFLKKWYKEVGGYKTNIDSFVEYQWSKSYNVGGALKNLVFELKQNY